MYLKNGGGVFLPWQLHPESLCAKWYQRPWQGLERAWVVGVIDHGHDIVGHTAGSFLQGMLLLKGMYAVRVTSFPESSCQDLVGVQVHVCVELIGRMFPDSFGISTLSIIATRG